MAKDIKKDLIDFLRGNTYSTAQSADLVVPMGETETIASDERFAYDSVDIDGTLTVDGELKIGDRPFSVKFDRLNDIGFEAYDDIDEAVYITPVSEDATVPGGGQTQYSGIDPGGDGGIADVVVSVQIDCWGGDRDDQIHADNNTHPDIVANELSQEVYRVLFETDHAAAGPSVPAGYDWINAEPPREADDLEQSPTKYRDIVVARLKYTQTP